MLMIKFLSYIIYVILVITFINTVELSWGQFFLFIGVLLSLFTYTFISNKPMSVKENSND